MILRIKIFVKLWRITGTQLLSPTMFEGARAICLGTRFRHDDIHNTTFLPSSGWKQIVQSAITVDKEGEEISYWPENVVT